MSRATPSRLIPLHHQVYLHLRDLIAGTPENGGPLPSEPALAARFGVSRVTIRTTLARLESEGRVRRVRGLGTFPVSPDKSIGRADIGGHLDSLISVENRTEAETLSWSAAADPDGAVLAALGPEPCLRLVRVRRYQGRPVSFTILSLPGWLAPQVPLPPASDEPVVRVLERQGIVARTADQVLSATAAEPAVARHLDVAAGAPLIVMRRLMYDEARRPILHQESLYVPDRFEYRMQLSRTSVGPAGKWTPIG